jgi:predicted amidophosphoribosyltransferase
MTLNPQAIEGPWRHGIVLDWHTVDSQVIGQNEYGHPVFDTTRTEIGELLYQFKYRSSRVALQKLLALAASRLVSAKGKFDLVLPVPPSNPTRTVTQQIAAGIASGLAAGTSTTALTKVRPTDELKSVTDVERRKELLTGVFAADSRQISGKRILLVDDLYRSGATLAAATEAVYAQGRAQAVYAFAVTRTRVNR